MNHIHRVLLAAAIGWLAAGTPASAQVSRDSAIQLVTDQVIDVSPYNTTLVAFLYDPPGPDTTLPAGTDIAPYDSAFVTTLSAPKWFFWLDLTGDIRFEHPCQFVLVDPVTGVVEVTDGGWWPIVTPPASASIELWPSIDDRVNDTASHIHGSYSGELLPPGILPGAGPMTRSTEPPGELREGIRFHRSPFASSGNTCGILVGGRAHGSGETNVWQSDIDSMRTAWTTPAPGGGAAMASETQEKNNATKADVQRMVDTAAAHGCNSILFYYSGHGGQGGGGFMDLLGPDLTYADLATMLNIAGLKFKTVIIDACYSGTALDDFGGKSTTVTITTASDSTKTSSASVTYIDRDTSGGFSAGDTIVGGGSKYTRSWMECWRKLRDSLNRNPTPTEIHKWVRQVNPDSINQKQNPSSTVLYPTITFVGNINSPGVYNFPGTNLVIDFQNIGGPFQLTIDRVLGPPSGELEPIQTELHSLSLVSHWRIGHDPPQPFQANILFQNPLSDPFWEPFPIEDLAIATRPSPSIPDPEPFWTAYPNLDYPPAQEAIVALNVTEFSEWSFALLASPATVNIDAQEKWNMLSVPVEAVDMGKTAVFPSAISSAFGYGVGYFTATTLENGRGYWLKYGGATIEAVTGNTIDPGTYPVVEGWNMVGSVTDPVDVSGVTTIPPSMTLSSFYAYSTGYDVAATIVPGQGYWVKASEAGSIVLDATPAAAAATRPVARFDGLHELEVEDARGMRQTLRFGTAPGASSTAGASSGAAGAMLGGAGFAGLAGEMPPKPPAGAFDARFAGDRMVGLLPDAGGGSLAVELSSAVHPLTVRWRIAAGETREFLLNGAVRMAGSGSAVLREEGGLTITASGSGLPVEYALHQNHPNPFNPSTRIAWEMPEPGPVRLAVYDLLGREAALLAAGDHEAGTHEVEFDAGALSSGVYFYRIDAGSFTAVRKLVVMR